MIFSKKASRLVRLFSCLIVSLASVQADDTDIPIGEKKEALARASNGSAASLIPHYEEYLVGKIYEHILATQESEHENYRSEIPETGTPYEMRYLKGGRFLMGSPDQEAARNLDEGPQREVTVSDFWMVKYETTWAQFMPFAQKDHPPHYTKSGTPKHPKELDKLTDWISSPTQVSLNPDFGMGMDDDYPAVGMTQNAALRFCQWLSAQTGHFYRLPTEAEWEFACRAGTTGTFSCPEDQLEDYAVIDPQQLRACYEKTGSKKPNPWGLYDMHGNVMEWCLDAYRPGYDHLEAENPWIPATQRYSRVIRGGSWYDTAEYCRSASRNYSYPDINRQDPQSPQSIWWLADAFWLGFRIVRPVEIPPQNEMYKIWNSGAIHHQKEDGIFEPR